MSANQRIAWEDKYDSQGVLWSRTHDDWFEVQDGDFVLDLGSGSGKSARTMKGNVVAVDFSVIALRAVREHLPSVSTTCADVRNLPFRKSVFDFVRASFVMDHLTAIEQQEAMGGIREVMKQGAQIAIECFSVSDGRYADEAFDKHGDFIDGDGILHHPFNEAEITGLVSGMDIELLTKKSWNQGIGSGKTMKRHILRVLARK